MLPPAAIEPAGDLATDLALSARTTDLRRSFLTAMAAIAHSHPRTPPVDSWRSFPGTTTRYRFAYDRQHAPATLELRLADDEGPRAKEAMLCASGMAALNTVLQSLAFLDPDSRQTLGALAGYYETHSLLRLSSFARRWTRLFDGAALCEAVRQQSHHILLIEPVRYDWALGTVPWNDLAAALRGCAAPPIVIVDTTLSGDDRPLAAAMAMLAASDVPLVIRVRSGLKLDQEGLELANLGIIEWWPRRDLAGRYASLGRTLNTFRVVSGAGIGWSDACSLSPAFVLEPTALTAYSRGVLDNNRTLAERLDLTGRLFERVTFPRAPWNAPFLFLPLRDGRPDKYRTLAAIIARAAKARGLDWTMSGSFGFREGRWETIQPEEQLRFREASPGILKVAAGRYRGAQFDAVAELLNDLAACDDLSGAARRVGG